MSATESKVKTAPKTSKKTLKSAEAEALKVALDAAQVEYVPVTALVKSPLNVRTIPYPAEKVCSMADSIEGHQIPCCRIWSCITSRMVAVVCGCRWSSPESAAAPAE